MEFFLILFLLLNVVGVIEIILLVNWTPFYFTYGLKIYEKVIQPIEPEKLPESIPANLSNYFKNNRELSSLCFKEIDGGIIGFREKMFFINVPDYTPIMHGKIIVDPTNKKIRIVGILDWFPIVFALDWFSLTLVVYSGGFGFIFLLVVLVFIYGLIYFVQAAKYDIIYNYFKDLNK